MKSLTQKTVLIFLLLSKALWSQTAPTLNELIDSALIHDSRLIQQKLENQLTLLDDERLKDVFLPKVDLTGKTGYLYTSANIKMPGLDISPEVYIPERNNHLNISGFSAMAKAEASMLIYSGGKVKYLKEANKEKSISEQLLMEKTYDDVVSEISKLYDQIALLNQTEIVLDEAKKRLDINKKTAEKALGYGLITPYDNQKIELAQAVLDSKIIEFHGKRELLFTQLNLLTGIEKERLQLIEPNLETIDYLIGEGDIQNRAEIKALEHGILAAENKIKAEEKWWIPKVMAQTSLTYIGLFDSHITTSKELIYGTGRKLDWRPSSLNVFPVFQAGIGFKWDIFDGNEGKTMVQEAQINKEILKAKKTDAERMLKLNLANNQTNYDIANAQIEVKLKQVEIAEKALVNVEKEFRYGTKIASDLIEAENDLVNSQLELLTAIFNQRRNAVELMKSTQDLNINKL